MSNRNLILSTDKAAAVAELTSLIHFEALSAMSMGLSYKPTDKAPESFAELKKQVAHSGGIIPIADYGCDHTIYPDPETNLKFRFWHDSIHLAIDKGFSYREELDVASCHLAVARAAGLSPLALSILEADTLGQTEYYKKYHEFVHDQDAFCDSVLQNGLKIALMVKH